MKEITIFYNGHIRPVASPYAREAVVVKNGKIVAIGESESILLDHGRREAQLVNLEGGYIYPGLTDSHLHLSGVGQKRRWLDVSACRSKDELLQMIRIRSGKIRPGQWVLGMGWDENEMRGQIPTLDELDEASGNHPLFLVRICHHAALVNRMAYQLAGVREDEPDLEQGAWGRDERGQLNGIVYEDATRIFYDVQPKPDYAEKKETIRLAMQEALACGLTCVHTEDLRYIESVAEMVRIYRELNEEGVMLRTHHLIYYPYLEELADRPWAAGAGDEWFRPGAVKIFADGSLGGRTALLSQPYLDKPDQRGIAIHDTEELAWLTKKAAEYGMPVAVHAIGDEAAANALQAMETYPFMAAKNGISLRHRLIHAQLMRPDLIRKMKNMPVVADIQSRFAVSDFPWVMDRIGETLIPYAYAWKTLLQAGVCCAGGSDAPIEPLHPVWGIHAAVTRRAPHEPFHPGYLPEQKLSVAGALSLYTIGSAYAAGEEKERGRLETGCFADMTIYDQDLFATDPDEWGQVQTLMTVVNGKIAYRTDR
ncbi:amidohydrolase [Thermoactinomyces mirandus]|uniref:Amidohydrolase family protein n=1 Tax=Thermoactinomyces mirandus TaxID=2756294 RepID=A0A7W1XQQ6_9BACL|nr:amidohydrolase [Thermoactinomyces mirandus]MBA4601513.1 amidohydrolase family protein [Thermoactinomyces mirandus]